MRGSIVAVALLLAIGGAIAALLSLHPSMSPRATAHGQDGGAHPNGMPPAPPATAPPAARPDAGLATASGAGTVVVSGRWGSGPGQFARKRDPESNPELPMAVTVLGDGTVLVLDQLNRRVQRFRDGKLVGTIELGGDTAQDVVAGKGGATLVLDRLADRNVQVYGPDGKLVNALTLEGKGIPEGGGVTGLFADDEGIYAEREHRVLVRIADASGNNDPARPTLVGRPSRDGKLLLSAAIADRAAGTVQVRAFDRRGTAAGGAPVWVAMAALGEPVLHLVTVDSDRQGRIYVVGATGRESPSPPYQIVDAHLVVARLLPGGQPAGVLVLPPLAGGDESFRPVTVGDDGAIYVEEATDAGLDVRRYVFP